MVQKCIMGSSGGGVAVSPYILNKDAIIPVSTAVASSTYPDSSNRFIASKAYDGLSNTAWLPAALGNNTPYYIDFDLGDTYEVKLIYIQFAGNDANNYTETLALSGSDDGITFKPILPTSDSMTIANGWNNQGNTIPSKANYIVLDASYRYFRVEFSRVSGYSNFCLGIGEIKFYGDY